MHGLPQRPNFGQRPNAQTAPSARPHNASTSQVTLYGFANQQNSGTSAHYAQAYAQYYTNAQTTPEGYSYSSTYNPRAGPAPAHAPLASSSSGFPVRGAPSRGGRGGGGRAAAPAAHWYSPGSARCAHPGCAFTGSAKAVETHRMDRHLIYPPGWEKRKKDDWDADPSLKGKPVPIQGTSVKLDSPEEIAAWIEERKRRFPTAERVDEKKRRLEEAIARGQLHPDDPGLRGNKRRRVDDAGENGARGGRGGGRGMDGRRGRGAGRGTGRGGPGQTVHGVAPAAAPALGLAGLPAKPSFLQRDRASASPSISSSEDEDDDGPPEEASSKHQQPANPSGTFELVNSNPDAASSSAMASIPTTVVNAPPNHGAEARRRQPLQPRKAPTNPFAPKSSLLRNLLSTEIRMTVSNLSQAIHFLVDNDFLDNVELKPGEAEPLIEVIEGVVSAGSSAEGRTSAPDEISTSAL